MDLCGSHFHFCGWGWYLLDIPELDGVASVIIGLILGATAILLAYESKGLLIGEAASDDVVQAISDMVKVKTEISAVNEILTMHMGLHDILLNLSLDFKDDFSAADVENSVSQLEKEIKACMPQIKRIFIEAQGN